LTPSVKTYLKEVIGEEPKHVEITEASSQLVNGTNHFVKVKHDGKTWHIRLHEALPCYGSELTVHSHREVTDAEPLTYF
uniref:Cystatin domain-containing protein n=1 Tax=Mesocestoides corti TaxID=53468 RepID=A0A5K3F8C9_MESCO